MPRLRVWSCTAFRRIQLLYYVELSAVLYFSENSAARSECIGEEYLSMHFKYAVAVRR